MESRIRVEADVAFVFYYGFNESMPGEEGLSFTAATYDLRPDLTRTGGRDARLA